MAKLSPADAQEAAEVVAWACAEEEPLELLGGGSKRPLGRPLQVAHALDLSRLSGIVDYEPAELVLTAQAATPLPEIEAALAGRGQMLAFEPPDWRGLLGTPGCAQTIGGVLACNLAGSRRIAGGAARDHFLGFHAVNGRGERFKAGGKVVKNVTGYDLCKLMAGSHGTLAALTEVSVKVLPRAETARTMLVTGLDDPAAMRAMSDALGSPHEISGAAHLPAAVAARSAVVAAFGTAVTALRLEGPAPSVAHRAEALRRELGATESLDAAQTAALWREIGDAALLSEPRDASVWRISVPPATGARVAAAIRARVACALFYDWGGGLIWLAVDVGCENAGAAAVREACAGGHATLIRAAEALRATTEVFQPQPAALAGLSSRVKNSFDPRRVLNPGRMYAGI